MEDATLDSGAAPVAEDKGTYGALAFTAPWFVVSLLLPEPHRLASVALVVTLTFLLAGAARWSWHRATERGLDAERWAFFASVTFGASMMLLLLPARLASERSLAEGIACGECGRVQLASEPFCFGCGAA